DPGPGRVGRSRGRAAGGAGRRRPGRADQPDRLRHRVEVRRRRQRRGRHHPDGRAGCGRDPAERGREPAQLRRRRAEGRRRHAGRADGRGHHPGRRRARGVRVLLQRAGAQGLDEGHPDRSV
ncbi:MAG: hypothetical protein AVDCRST_MAG49-4630, partial [uncultured Thermomicrobiales bacterium]